MKVACRIKALVLVQSIISLLTDIMRGSGDNLHSSAIYYIDALLERLCDEDTLCKDLLKVVKTMIIQVCGQSNDQTFISITSRIIFSMIDCNNNIIARLSVLQILSAVV
jgi:hypothetical protein